MESSLYLVVGLGKTGHSIARFLHRRNRPFVVFDTRKEPKGYDEFKSDFPTVDVFFERIPEELYSQFIAVICSPGVALDHPVVHQACELGIPVYGDIECLAQEITAPVIAITGTNGKSTVTTLVGDMVKTSGLSVAVGGNIGTPVLDLLDDGTCYDVWVLELSSFQLELTYSLRPVAATILNITPDHIDRHHSFDAYCQAKQRIYHHASFLLYNREDNLTHPIVTDTRSYSSFSSFGLSDATDGEWGLITEDNTIYLAYGSTRIVSVDELRIKGQHNWLNALAACALAHAAGVSFVPLRSVLSVFSGLPHRSQWIRTLDGVAWINDSKGTNIGATLSALSGIGRSMVGKIVLIAGGQGKGASFVELRAAMTEFVRLVVLIGEDANKIERDLMGVVAVLHAPSLEAAVIAARSQAVAGDVVLLSPACASLDMFRDFNHRGEVFIEAVSAL